jgi:DNA (cytosine-5)-methyltransferase 1
MVKDMVQAASIDRLGRGTAQKRQCSPRIVSLQEAARILKVEPDDIRRWEKKKLIKARNVDKQQRFYDLNILETLQGRYLGNSAQSGFQVLNAKKTNFSVIELFSGCGGMALGFENAGLRAKLLVEIDKNAVATLSHNRPNWQVINSDISLVDFDAYKGTDIVAGGFPCQAFSYAGNSKGFEDTRGTLFFEFARCVQQVQPKIAIAENVRGLLEHDEGKTFATMRQTLEMLGYRVAYKLLRAQFLDVAQKRERLFIVGIRNDMAIEHFFPKEKEHTVSLREALFDCPASIGAEYPVKKKAVMALVPPGGYWRDLPEAIQKEYMMKSFYLGGGKTGMARRLSWDEPSLTLTCSPAQKQTERCHPSETRPLNIREYARIQSFPDEWEFIGSVASQYKQIGNAVPVNLAYHMGRCLVAMLSDQFDAETMSVVTHENSEESDPQQQLSLFS